MKKFIYLVLIISIIFVSFNNNKVSAKTLGDLKRELSDMEANYSAQQQKQQLTQQEINNVYASISSIKTQINDIEVERVRLTKEIEDLTISISEKEEEIKKIINFVQISSGESAYLEYAFGAKDFTDFIYRVSVSEQLTNHNDQLIKEYNQLIEDNNQKKIDLNNKEVELNNNQKELAIKLQSLGKELDSVLDLKLSVEEEIKLQKEAIDMYQNKLGCKDDEDIKLCGIKYLPIGTSFYRPIVNGYVTSEFGDRCFVLNGAWYCDFHSGVDLSTGEYAPNVYATAPGMVAGVLEKTPCGGNQVFIHHNINGVTYTTHYAHLLSINVKKGDIVTSNTVIGKMGGNPAVTTWDSCSTGQHLHFAIAKGLYLKDYYSWAEFIARQLRPRDYVNLPSGLYNSFSGRTIMYN